ncbi:MAG TPA: ATP-dependent sacrificial sulfur transferase LarE [Longimicrobiales bacterium]|nr:ATP-dependent sacrificial sulfur transferase LarE [Longimicrobiales bacterium]
MTKLQHLEKILNGYGSVLIGYSGGVDSVFLAAVAVDVLGKENVLAVTGRSASYPDVQWQVARDVAQQFSIPHLEIDTDEMHDASYLANPTNRCYFCKTELWSKLVPLAKTRGYDVVVDGSNADDASDYRPGAQAAKEHDVRSPLMEAGLTKAEIRELSLARDLPTWDQPSAPCLSSRLPYGFAVTPERLKQVERAEDIVRSAGIKEFRVRHHGDIARLEISPAEIPAALANAETLSQQIEALGFRRVVLDVEGYRRGALNEALVQLNSRPDIAIVDGTLAHAREKLADFKKSGFRYVAVDLKVSA